MATAGNGVVRSNNAKGAIKGNGKRALFDAGGFACDCCCQTSETSYTDDFSSGTLDSGWTHNGGSLLQVTSNVLRSQHICDGFAATGMITRDLIWNVAQYATFSIELTSASFINTANFPLIVSGQAYLEVGSSQIFTLTYTKTTTTLATLNSALAAGQLALVFTTGTQPTYADGDVWGVYGRYATSWGVAENAGTYTPRANVELFAVHNGTVYRRWRTGTVAHAEAIVSAACEWTQRVYADGPAGFVVGSPVMFTLDFDNYLYELGNPSSNVPNSPPLWFNPGTGWSGTVGVAFSKRRQCEDFDGDTLTFSATSLPPGLSMNSSTGTVSGTPTTAGTYNATLTADDGTDTSDYAITITIS